ncbi:YjfB family protein [Roseateles sp.]|uniref:YjfB family protein n=1 Tax=Roseateles sp. TaxID=1971397 RepID=UPI003266D3DF
MDVLSSNSAVVGNASAAVLGTVQGSASLSILRKSMDLQESTAAQLLQALPQPALATSGTLGTRLNTYA